MNINGFIFDLDGTLLDSMGAWDNLGMEYLLSKGINDVPKIINDILMAMSLLQSAEYFNLNFHLNLSIRQIMDEINHMIEDKYKYDIKLKEGVIDFLENNKHLKMCIATATDKHLVYYALKRLKIDKYFEFVITSTEAGSSKQSPYIFIKAAERLCLPIDEIIVFEDAPHAISSAKSAGFYTVGVYESRFEKDRALIKQTADCYIESFYNLECIAQ